MGSKVALLMPSFWAMPEIASLPSTSCNCPPEIGAFSPLPTQEPMTSPMPACSNLETSPPRPALLAVVGEQAAERAGQATEVARRATSAAEQRTEIAEATEAAAALGLLLRPAEHLTEYRIEQSHDGLLNVEGWNEG